MKYLITGGCGFLGSNIAAKLITANNEVHIIDDLSREGSSANLAWLGSMGPIHFLKQDLSKSQDELNRLLDKLQPDVIYHLAGQVAMTTSIVNPKRDFEINALGTLNLLEAIRLNSANSSILYSSTNKVYGDLNDEKYEETNSRYLLPSYPNGLPESLPLNFHSPYGCSKGCAEQYILDYSRIYNLKAAVFRHSSMYGGRQFSTIDQGWIGWFCKQAILQLNTTSYPAFSISGSGKQVRDVLYADDMVELYLLASENIEKIQGEAFNIGGGIVNSLSILELLDILEKRLGIRLRYYHINERISDQKVFVADNYKVTNALGWKPKVDKELGISKMLSWIIESGVHKQQ